MKSLVHLALSILVVGASLLVGPTDHLKAQSSGTGAEAWRLDRIGHDGDTATYGVWRENLTMGRDGTVLSTMEASGVLTRTLVQEVATGLWRERVDWREYHYGEGALGSAGPDPLPVKGVVGVGYEIDPSDDPLSWVNAPSTEIAPGPASIFFAVLALDAWSWDGLVYELRRAGHGTVHRGETITLDAWKEPRETGSGASGLKGQYRLGVTDVTVVGRVGCGNSQDCLRLSFRVGPSEVVQEMPGIKVSGQEYIAGTADLSLDDGSLIRGELWGPMIAAFQANGSALPVSAVLQRVTTRRVR
jgi:hypothetical protein